MPGSSRIPNRLAAFNAGPSTRTRQTSSLACRVWILDKGRELVEHLVYTNDGPLTASDKARLRSFKASVQKHTTPEWLSTGNAEDLLGKLQSAYNKMDEPSFTRGFKRTAKAKAKGEAKAKVEPTAKRAKTDHESSSNSSSDSSSSSSHESPKENRRKPEGKPKGDG